MIRPELGFLIFVSLRLSCFAHSAVNYELSSSGAYCPCLLFVWNLQMDTRFPAGKPDREGLVPFVCLRYIPAQSLQHVAIMAEGFMRGTR